MCRWCGVLVLTMGLLLTWTMPVAAAPSAQSGQEQVYVVQPGDTLSSIAAYFGVSLADLLAVNRLDDPDHIAVGQRLIIPAPGMSSDRTGETATAQVYVVQPGDTLWAIAMRYGVTVDELMQANGLQNADLLRVGQSLVIPVPGATMAYPPPFVAVALGPTPIVQGQTLVVRVVLSQTATLSGEFDGRMVPFVSGERGGWAVLGIHALQPLGGYQLVLRARLADARLVTATVPLSVQAGPYDTENIELAPGREALLDPALVQAEQNRLIEVWSRISPRPLWKGLFRMPLATHVVTSQFGTRRSYNEGPVSGFHGGVDFSGETGTPIYAPAAGRVVLAEQLMVRGGSVLIDHGLGVYSGYWHQSKLAVEVGQWVEAGQLIGYVGDTGLVSGSHLHWELRVGGIAVDPMQWTKMSIP